MKTTPILAAGIALTLPMCASTSHHNHPVRTAAQLQEIFARKDRNHDGYLSRDEFIARSKDVGKSTRVFIKKDKNGDNRLTEQEFATPLPKHF